jgi:hypothetical protein
MSDSFLTAEVESLVQGYVEGELTAPECTRLRELLQASPSLVTSILMSLRTDVLIRQVVLETTSVEIETAPYSGVAQGEKAVASLKPGRDSRFTLALAVAASVMVLIALGALFFGSRHARQTVALPERSFETGSILYEYWAGIPGDAVTNLTLHPGFQRAPTSRAWLPQFEAPSQQSQDYGARLRGYLHPPVSGSYLFWIASDDASELWLSEDENPANKRRLCFVDSWVPSHEWTWHPSQQSPPIRLEAGRRYYIEALHKQGNAADSLAVAWQAPGAEREIIPGRALSPIINRP